MVKLPDPQVCKKCGKKGHVVNTRSAAGYRWRRLECVNGCIGWRNRPHRWNTYETLHDPTLQPPEGSQNTTG